MYLCRDLILQPLTARYALYNCVDAAGEGISVSPNVCSKNDSASVCDVMVLVCFEKFVLKTSPSLH